MSAETADVARRVAYPKAPREAVSDTLFGHVVPDPYRWLEDAGRADVQEWQRAQDALFADFCDARPERAAVRQHLTDLFGIAVVSTPAWRGDRYFLQRRQPGQEHPVVYVVEPDGTERVLLDPMRLDPTGRTTLDIWQPSRDGRLVAYQTSANGTEEGALRLMDVDTGEIVDGPIDRMRHSSIAWLPGDEAYYYVRRLPPESCPAGEERYHRRVYLHRVGTDCAQDVPVFGAGLDKTAYLGVSLSRDGRWLIVSVTVGATRMNSVWLADLDRGAPESPELRLVQPESPDASVVFVGPDGRGYAATNLAAPRGRLCVFDPETEDSSGWRTLVEQRPDTVLRTASILDGPGLARPVLLANWTRHAMSAVTIHDLASGAQLGELALPGLGTVGALGVRPEGGHEAWFTYSDSVTPPRVYRYDAVTGEVSPWVAVDRIEVPPVRTVPVSYPSRDGTPVRMTVTYPDGDPADGGPAGRPRAPRPVLLRGYGGFGVPATPHYSPQALAWVQAGGVYVDTQLRGGGEEGEEWHRAGMREHKQNTFDDFHAAAEWLIDQGWTTPAQLAVSGASNGGLLVGAALTQRPELYGCAVVTAPLLDMVRYEQFGLGASWRGEYGTAADPEQLAWLLSYSPYHHVRPGVSYPAVLFAVFDNDTRVDPLHARKTCAALQHATAADAPVLLRREDLGHGARSVSSSIGLLADTLVFAAAHTGLDLRHR